MNIDNLKEIKHFISTETNINILQQLYAVCYNAGFEKNAKIIWVRIRELKTINKE